MRGDDLVMTEPYWTAAQRLWEMEVVQKNCTDLYFHVLDADLIPAADQSGSPPVEGVAPILLCRGTAALAMVLPEGATARALPGLPQLYWAPAQENGLAETLEKVLQQPAQWRLEMEPAAEEMIPALARVHLIQRRGSAWLPTRYGVENRMVTRGSFSRGRIIWETCCSPGSWKEVKKLLEWKPDSIVRAGEPIPFARRKIRAAEGIPANGLYSARAVLRLARTPLTEYMAGCPESLKELRRWLPLREDTATYMDAALLIGQLFLPPEKRPPALRGISEDVSRTLLEHLAHPLDRIYSGRRWK